MMSLCIASGAHYAAKSSCPCIESFNVGRSCDLPLRAPCLASRVCCSCIADRPCCRVQSSCVERLNLGTICEICDRCLHCSNAVTMCVIQGVPSLSSRDAPTLSRSTDVSREQPCIKNPLFVCPFIYCYYFVVKINKKSYVIVLLFFCMSLSVHAPKTCYFSYNM